MAGVHANTFSFSMFSYLEVKIASITLNLLTWKQLAATSPACHTVQK